MPRMKAAKKALKQSLKKYERNRSVKRLVKETIKEVEKLAKEGKKAEVLKKLPEVFSVIDKAAKQNLLHKNNAARKKSALSKLAAR